MIIRFSVTNFRSIRQKSELSMVKSGLTGLNFNFFKAGPKLNLLKSAIIFGPNASGKSAFLRAFKALEYLVKHSSSFKPGDSISPYEPYKLEKTNSKAPVIFEIDFISKGIRYEYFLSFVEKQIVREDLFHYPNAIKTSLFSRFAGREIKFGESYKGGKKTVEKLLLDSQLFLSKAAENNVESVMDVFEFFDKGLMVFPSIEGYHENTLSRLFARRLAEHNDSKFTRRFNKLICALDTGISGVSAVEIDWNDYKFPVNLPETVREKFQEQYKYDIKTQHPLFENDEQVGTEIFELEEESAGTKSLFVIGGIILDALEGGRVLIVDEFEKNLHSGITQFLIKLFHNPVTNPNNAQLIFATHDITQLSNDIFRRDQVWFVEKNEFGVSSIYRCSDIKGIRLGTPLDKWYASGRFGATPIVNDVDFLIEMQSDAS